MGIDPFPLRTLTPLSNEQNGALRRHFSFRNQQLTMSGKFALCIM